MREGATSLDFQGNGKWVRFHRNTILLVLTFLVLKTIKKKYVLVFLSRHKKTNKIFSNVKNLFIILHSPVDPAGLL